MNVNKEIGLKFNRLTILKEADPYILPCGQTNKAYLCKCECGKEKVIRRLHLVRGSIKSCGCFKTGLKMGKTESEPKLKKVWRQFKNRCTENYFESHLYFKKGIKVCKEWSEDYSEFKKWSLQNGYKLGLEIDRKDNSKGYSPENCRWVTTLVNSMNKDNTYFVTYKGEKKPLMLIITEKKIREHASTIRSRIKRGWTVEDAIDTPIRKGNYYTIRTQKEINDENELMFSRL